MKLESFNLFSSTNFFLMTSSFTELSYNMSDCCMDVLWNLKLLGFFRTIFLLSVNDFPPFQRQEQIEFLQKQNESLNEKLDEKEGDVKTLQEQLVVSQGGGESDINCEL